MGIDIQRLVTENQEWAICAICNQVLLDIRVLECEHYFCKSCIIKWLEKNPTCPECRVSICEDKFKNATVFMKRIFQQVKIKCKYDDCQQSIEYENFIEWDTYIKYFWSPDTEPDSDYSENLHSTKYHLLHPFFKT